MPDPIIDLGMAAWTLAIGLYVARRAFERRMRLRRSLDRWVDDNTR